MKALSVTRRRFLELGALAGAGLLLEALPDGLVRAAEAAAGEGAVPFAPNPWLRVAPDGRVTIVVARAEMGQGVRTSLPLIVAEELRVDPAGIDVITAEPGPDYPEMRTSGSGSVLEGFAPLLRAGAAARLMLVAAAARSWGVPVGECEAQDGRVTHAASARKLSYGALASRAAREPVPATIPLARTFTRVGTRVRRHDGPAIVHGAAVYGLDMRVPGMRHAAIARPTSFGATVASVDDAKAHAVPGVLRVERLANGVAVVANSTWAALAGRDALVLAWSPGADAAFDSRAFQERLAEATKEAGRVSREEGDPAGKLATAARRLDALYEYGFHAHAPMEPMNAIAHAKPGGCELWVGTQAPNQVQDEVAARFGYAAKDVRVHVPLLGGGFGRRLGTDYALEAVELSRAIGEPVQVVWTREDDMRHGFFQPASANRLAAGLDAEGRPVAWLHTQAAAPHNYWHAPNLDDPELAADNLWGVHDQPYVFPSLRTAYVPLPAPVPLGPWRSVFYPTGVFARECFLDELAHAAGQDPLAYRLALLPGGDGEAAELRGALARALQAAATRAGWGRPLPKGHGLGIAGNVYHGMTVMAQVAEVSRREDGSVRVHRVVCAVDCGRAVNPLGVEGQVESAIVWGLSGAICGEITFKDGRAEQANFGDYPVLRFSESPVIEIEIVPSAFPPLGIGEQPVAPVAAAVGNALFAATGKRVRRLPIRPADLG
jgi:isoquinoline 1-oxidoreductase beta subunit